MPRGAPGLPAIRLLVWHSEIILGGSAPANLRAAAYFLSGISRLLFARDHGSGMVRASSRLL